MKELSNTQRACFTEGFLWVVWLCYFILFIFACFIYRQNTFAISVFAFVAAVHLTGAVHFSWQRHVKNKYHEYDTNDI